jgi:TPR repeat protein
MVKTHRRFKKSRTIKPYRVVSRRNKKRNGGMFSQKALMDIPEGASPALVSKAQTGPGSGMLDILMKKLHEQPLSDLPVPGGMPELVSKTVSSMGNEAFANAMFEDAAHLRATSFRSLNVEECAQIIRRVVAELNQAIAMGNLKARACLADMLLHGNAVGVAANFDEAVDLVSQHDRMDPDCAGVLAQCHFHADELNDARSLAEGAAVGSKYGQLVLGLLEKRKGNFAEAAAHFARAADQKYDEAQFALAEMHFKGWKTPANRLALPNFNEAFRLLSAAALQGNKRAFHFISAIYRTKLSQDEAKRWFGYYVEAGELTSPELKDARNQRKMQYYEGGYARKHYNKAQSNVGFLRKRANQGRCGHNHKC